MPRGRPAIQELSFGGQPTSIIVTCEHGGNRVPPGLRALFEPYTSLLVSHRDYDPGALILARQLAGGLGAPLLHSTVTCLLVDLNRSQDNPTVFSEVTSRLSAEERAALIQKWHKPYRSAVRNAVSDRCSSGGRVLHFSSHSFTPMPDGLALKADVGLLFDPARTAEAAICGWWQQAIHAASALVVRNNYPQSGADDSLTATLRCRFPARRYAGIELQINQTIVSGNAKYWKAVRRTLMETLREVLAAHVNVGESEPAPQLTSGIIPAGLPGGKQHGPQ